VLFRLDLRPNLGVCFPSNQSPLCDQLAGSGTSSWGSAPFALFILHVAQMLYYVLTCNMNIHFALCGRIGWGKDLGYRCFARLPRGAWWHELAISRRLLFTQPPAAQAPSHLYPLYPRAKCCCSAV